MSATQLTVSKEIQDPRVGHLITSYARELYNYNVTIKTTSSPIEILKKQGDDIEKAHYMLSNVKATILNLSAFVKEVHERKFNAKHDPLTIKASAGLMISTALFVSMIFFSQMRKAAVQKMPILTNVYNLGEGVLERDIMKTLEAFEALIDATLSDKKAITADSEKEDKETNDSKDFKGPTESKKIDLPEIELVLMTDEPREDMG